MRGRDLAVVCATAAMMAARSDAGIRPLPARTAEATCLRSLRPLVRTDVPRSSDFEPAPCVAKTEPAAFYYDRASGATRAAKDIAAGEVVASFPEFGRDVIRPGQRVKLVVTVGAVRVERDVEALQEAASGEWLFVRDGKGQVFSVRYEAASP